MTPNSSGRRERQLLALRKLKADRQAAREKRDREIRRQLDEARAAGTQEVAWWRSPFGLAIGKDEKGRPVTLRGGRVEMVNPPNCQYDYRVTIELADGAARVSELAAIRRPDGPNISRRGMQAEPIGFVYEWATARLTSVGKEPAIGISRGDARELLRGQRRRGRGESRDDELSIVAHADQEAERRSLPVKAFTAQLLSVAGYPSSDSTVKVLRRRAVAEGLILPRPRGRPRRR
jgi:hypothetical protein